MWITIQEKERWLNYKQEGTEAASAQPQIEEYICWFKTRPQTQRLFWLVGSLTSTTTASVIWTQLTCADTWIWISAHAQTQVLCAVWAQKDSTKGRPGGGGVVPGCEGGAGGWDGQDRLPSLPPVCHGWIGDYSSRCVIRSELYSCGCRVKRRVTRER